MAPRKKTKEDLVMDNTTTFNSQGQSAPEGVSEMEAFSSLGWKNVPTISELKGDLEYARIETNDQKSNVEGWINLRNATGVESGGKTRVPGRSRVQPKLIRKHNEWRYPGLSEPFLNSPDIYSIKPRTFRDVASARQNQLVLNYQWSTKLRKVDWIDKYVRKTVDEGTCIVRIGWDRKTEKVKSMQIKWDYYPMQDPQQLQVLAQATQMYMQDPVLFTTDSSIPESLLASVEYSAQNKTPVFAVENGQEELVEEKITFNQPTLKIVNIGNFFVDPSCEGDWEQAQFMIHTYETTQSDLKKRRIYKNLDKVNWSANRVSTQSGNQDHTSTAPQADVRYSSKKQKVLVYEYWGFADIYDTGEMCPIVMTWIGDTIIQMEENPFPDRKPPFIMVPYMPILNSVYGEADASLLQDNQRISGALTRGMIDLMGRSANAQTGYAKGFLDPMNRKRFVEGMDFEFNPNGDPEAMIRQMKYPELPQSALLMNQMQNADAEAMSGIKAFAGGINGDTFGAVAKNTGAVLDAAGQREMSLLRRLAEGMRLIGMKIIMLNQVYLEDEEVVPITDEKFVTVRKKDLSGNFDLICDIASAQMDDLRSKDLGMILQTTGPDMDPAERKLILAEIADLKRMPELAHSLRTFQSQPDPMEVEMHKKQLELLQSQIDLNEAQAKAAMATAGQKDLTTQNDANGVTHARDVARMGAQAEGNANLEVTKGLLAGDVHPHNIEAAVGFNKLTQTAAELKTQVAQAPAIPAPTALFNPQQFAPNAPAQGQQPLAPLQSAQQSQQNIPQSLALPG